MKGIYLTLVFFFLIAIVQGQPNCKYLALQNSRETTRIFPQLVQMGFPISICEGSGSENEIFQFKYQSYKSKWTKKELTKNYFRSKEEPKKPIIASIMWFHKNYYMNMFEVSNISWMEFLFSANLLDSMDIRPEKYVPINYFINEESYFLNPKYYLYPVVGITYEMAQKYCDWISIVLTKSIRHHGTDNVIRCRLPTEEEWERAASGNFKVLNEYGIKPLYWKYKISGKTVSFLSEYHSGYSKKELKEKIHDFNKNYSLQLIYHLKIDRPQIMTFDHPLSIYSFRPNVLGFFNIFGNVREMVAKKGVAKGGSFKTSVENSKYTSSTAYSKSEIDLGFRCLCEIN